jgi:ribosomal protein L18E
MMEVVIIVFMVIMCLFAVSSLSYVTVDIVIEQKNKKAQKAAVPAPVVVPVVEKTEKPAPKKEIIEEKPEIVEHIDAVEADAMISDDFAIKTAIFEKGAGHGKQGIVNIGDIDKVFEANAVVTMAKLKEVGLVHRNVDRIKVLAAGVLNKPLTIKAEHYSIQAMKMIELTGGTVIILKD